jgi:hypothetical protein
MTPSPTGTRQQFTANRFVAIAEEPCVRRDLCRGAIGRAIIVRTVAL